MNAVVVLLAIAAQTISVEEGAQTVLPAVGVTRIAVGDPAVADVKLVEGSELLITGVKSGTTSLILWFGELQENRTIEVGNTARLQEVLDLLDLLELPQLTTRQIGEKIVVDGTIADIEQYEKFDRLQRVAPSLVYLVRIDPSVFSFMGTQIEAALAAAGMPDARATVVGRTVFLEGSVSDEAEREKAEKIARAILTPIQ